MLQHRSSWLAFVAVVVSACVHSPRTPVASDQGSAGRPAVIAIGAGERAWLDSSRFTTLKVDPKTVGAERFALGAEALPPGTAIPVHRHLSDEELIIVHRGRARMTLGDSIWMVDAGGVAYIPRRTWVGIANAAQDTLTIFYVFPTPHFLDYMRGIASASPGGRRLAPAEAARIDRQYGIEYRR